MGFQALLFCPDDKTARTVTQVLAELEFAVEPCTEPFAAVKKLMAGHFDALVVDCDNEQNATLLFKSARNSQHNQASLAVAVVEGQAGVAKAFRIGANLVLTKPINVEQSKGTLRVARGLLRKGDGGKAAAASASGTTAAATAPVLATLPGVPVVSAPVSSAAASSAAKPAASKPLPPAKPPVVATSTGVPARSAAPATLRPAASANPKPAVPAASKPAAVTERTAAPSAPVTPRAPQPSGASAAALTTNAAAANRIGPPSATAAVPPAPTNAPSAKAADPEDEDFKPAFYGAPEGPVGFFGGGAASAPAPARVPQPAPEAQKPTEEPKPRTALASPSRAEEFFEKPAEPRANNTAVATVAEPVATASSSLAISSASTDAAPAFSFGGSTSGDESRGGGKKILIGVAALALVVGVGYAVWGLFQGHGSRAASTVATSATPSPTSTASASTPAAAPAKPAAASAGPASQPTQPAQSSPAATAPAASHHADDSGADNSSDEPKSSTTPTASTKPAPASASVPAAAPLIVKGGSAPVKKTEVPAADSPAPSMAGIASPGSGGDLSKLVNAGNSTPKPMLQTMNISQGVSRGLLVKQVQPLYPRSAIAMHVEGAVDVLATISKNGDITSVKVLKGDSQLSRPAVDAVKQWKYKPYLLNGEPIEVQTQITLNFRLPH